MKSKQKMKKVEVTEIATHELELTIKECKRGIETIQKIQDTLDELITDLSEIVDRLED